MTLTTAQKGIAFFTLAYVLLFGQFFMRSLNYEFVAYAGLIVVITILLFGTLKFTRFPNHILIGISIWGLLHMMGGSVMTPDGVLYAWRIYPFFDGGGEFYVLKFDQVVHASLYAVVALMFLHLLKRVYQVTQYEFLTAMIAIMASLGVSGINEIIEFTAVLLAPETGVGGYYNTMLDMVFNFGGALIAVLGYYLVKKLKRNH